MRLISFMLLALLLLSSCSPEKKETTLPANYDRASHPQYTGVKTQSVYVPMSDGVKLAIDIFLPTEGPALDKFPVVLSYTPYQRSRIDRETGKISDISTEKLSKLLLEQGYALVCADIRGTGASTGWLLDFMPKIWSDGRELVDWIAEQPWCDGNVGMRGGSYLGWSQLATASEQPAALKCIVPAVVPLEGYTGEVYPGGIYLQGFMKKWSSYMYLSTRNYYLPEAKLTSKPALDEDNDGDLLDEIPLDKDKNGTFLNDGFPPAYTDNSKRADVYYNLSKEHDEKNYDYTTWTEHVYYYDGKSPLGLTVYEIGPTALVHGIMESGIPVYNVGGWFDGFARGSFELFETMKKTNPSRIIMGPGYHNYHGGPFWKYFGISDETAEDIYNIEHLRFFDRHLKGIDNKIMEEPPILIYVMNGNGWRYENEWPLDRQQLTKFYVSDGNGLSTELNSPGTIDYTADYSFSSVYGSNKGNRWMGIAGGKPDAMPVRTRIDSSTLVFDTQRLESDMEVTGHPIVRLNISSDADYGDIFVYMNDVDADGEVILVSEGQLRAEFAALHDNDQMIQTHPGIDVLPELPWHGYRKEDYQDKIFANGNIVDLTIDLHPTSWVFKKGHKVRLSVACSDYPTFRMHPKLSPKNDPDAVDNIIPTITVHYGNEKASYIELPIIPTDK